MVNAVLFLDLKKAFDTVHHASFAIRSIGRIRRYLPYDGLKMLVNSLVISRLDYCNSVLYGIPKYQRGQTTENPEYRCSNDIWNTKH